MLFEFNDELTKQIDDILHNHPEMMDWDSCKLLAHRVVFQASKDAWYNRHDPVKVENIQKQMKRTIWCDILDITSDSVVYKAVKNYTPYGERTKKKQTERNH